MSRRISLIAGYEQHTTRMTRARAAAFQAKCCPEIAKPPLVKPDNQKKAKASKGVVADENNMVVLDPAPDPQRRAEVLKRVSADENSMAVLAPAPDLRIRAKALKRVSADENSISVSAPAPKRRAVLKDVTNICCDNLYKSCIDASKPQFNSLQKAKPGCILKLGGAKKGSKLSATSTNGSMLLPGNEKDKKVGGTHVSDTTALPEVVLPVKLEDNDHFAQQNDHDREGSCESTLHDKQSTGVALENNFPQDSVKEPSGNLTSDDNCGCIDIDLNHKNPQMCSSYAADIYDVLRANELIRRPVSNYMETIQRDITQSMRAILIDWLVEVADEYKLSAETLHLTVYLIDQFLSHNAIERQRLQLVGITCMLIAAKYEEIAAPRVEEFCLVTDNTYRKQDVLKMENQVLNNLSFRLAVPTVKTFLRRFVLAAQASYKAPSIKLEYLADYLAELTLTEYSFVSYLPSMVAASAVFLSRWTLDQSDHPWNSTLEHYTSYTALDLKDIVIRIQNLQANKEKCTLRSIRDKYRRSRFHSVAMLPPKEPLLSLF